MKVLKAINNNVVSCVNEDGRELIVMGRGLGFSASPGSMLDEKRAEKIFRMDTQGETERLKDLFTNLPEAQIALCTRLIAYANETLNKPLSKSIYLTLTDHISFSIDRMAQGITFQNPLLTEVRIFYPREFAVGCRGLEMIAHELGVSFPPDEAASIALHLVNAEYETSISETMHITQALHDIVVILRQWPGLTLQEDSLYYDELTVHLKFLAMRAFAGEQETQSEPEFVRTIRTIYPSEFSCAEAVAHYLEKQSGHTVSEEKKAYLAVHIRRTTGY